MREDQEDLDLQFEMIDDIMDTEELELVKHAGCPQSEDGIQTPKKKTSHSHRKDGKTASSRKSSGKASESRTSSKSSAGHKTARAQEGTSPGARPGKSGKARKRKASARTAKKAGKKGPNATHIHIAFAVVVLLIAIVGIVKLVKWNKGRESDYDPNEITTEFDTEPEDYFAALDSATAALQKNDGVTSILLLGNGSLAKTKGQEDSIGRRLEGLTGGKVYDASLDHTYLSVKNTVYDQEYPADVFSLYWMTRCITSGDFTLLEDTARMWDGDETVMETVDMLKNLDMETIDVITIMYDYHDYEDQRLVVGPYDETMAATCCGCLLQSLRLFQQTFPHIRLIVSSPYFNYIQDEDGTLQPGSIYNMGQGTLADYMVAYKNIAVEVNVSFIDNYFGTITEDNYDQYLEEDKEHLNAAGREAIAKRIATFIGS